MTHENEHEDLAVLPDNENDPVAVFAAAHAAVLKVAPRAHDHVVRSVAGALLMTGAVSRETVATIVQERDPIVRAIKNAMQERPRGMSLTRDDSEP